MLPYDPWIGRHRRLLAGCILFLILAGVLLLISIGNLFIPIFNVSWDAVSGIFRVGSIFIILVPGFLLERRALKKRLHRHQKILSGASDLLAKDQPLPNRYALQPPLTIALRPKATPMYLLCVPLVCIALMFAGLTIWALIVFFTTPYDVYYTGDDPVSAAITGGLALFFGLLVWMIWVLSRHWLKVTEVGLEARFRGRKTRIAWSEARFFCVDGVFKPGQPRTYTVSGERKSVNWMQVSESHPGFYQPALPFELYQQQSLALLEVVAGQTKLPLYDMRISFDEIYPIHASETRRGGKPEL